MLWPLLAVVLVTVGAGLLLPIVQLENSGWNVRSWGRYHLGLVLFAAPALEEVLKFAACAVALELFHPRAPKFRETIAIGIACGIVFGLFEVWWHARATADFTRELHARTFTTLPVHAITATLCAWSAHLRHEALDFNRAAPPWLVLAFPFFAAVAIHFGWNAIQAFPALRPWGTPLGWMATACVALVFAGWLAAELRAK